MTITGGTDSFASHDRGDVWDLVSEITVLIGQGANADITEDPLFWAMVPGRPGDGQRPSEDLWVPGFWLLDLGGTLACGTVGPGAPMGAFRPGFWTPWLRIQDNPTAPQAAVGTVVIT